jgi:hypothetical protein
MKSFSSHKWAAVIILVSMGFSFSNGLLVADAPTIFLAGLTIAGFFACSLLLSGSRPRRQAVPVARGHWRN